MEYLPTERIPIGIRSVGIPCAHHYHRHRHREHHHLRDDHCFNLRVASCSARRCSRYLDHIVVGDHIGDEDDDLAILIGGDSSNKMILMIKGG